MNLQSNGIPNNNLSGFNSLPQKQNISYLNGSENLGFVVNS